MTNIGNKIERTELYIIELKKDIENLEQIMSNNTNEKTNYCNDLRIINKKNQDIENMNEELLSLSNENSLLNNKLEE